jgi:hypothetical protein
MPEQLVVAGISSELQWNENKSSMIQLDGPVFHPGQMIVVHKAMGWGSIEVAEQPTEDNFYTLSIRIKDNNIGPAPHEIEVIALGE